MPDSDQEHTPLSQSKESQRLLSITAIFACIALFGSAAMYYLNQANKAACVVNRNSIDKSIQSLIGIEIIGQSEPLNWEDLDHRLARSPRPLPHYCPCGEKYILAPKYDYTLKTFVTCPKKNHNHP